MCEYVLRIDGGIWSVIGCTPTHTYTHIHTHTCMHTQGAGLKNEEKIMKTLCNTLQQSATHCNTLQHTATHCNSLQRTATHCNSLQHTATHYNALQHTATHCNTLQHTATHCNTITTTHSNTLQHIQRTSTPSNQLLDTLQHTATHSNTLQHTETHCNTLQHAGGCTTGERTPQLCSVKMIVDGQSIGVTQPNPLEGGDCTFLETIEAASVSICM